MGDFHKWFGNCDFLAYWSIIKLTLCRTAAGLSYISLLSLLFGMWDCPRCWAITRYEIQIHHHAPKGICQNVEWEQPISPKFKTTNCGKSYVDPFWNQKGQFWNTTKRRVQHWSFHHSKILWDKLKLLKPYDEDCCWKASEACQNIASHIIESLWHLNFLVLSILHMV